MPLKRLSPKGVTLLELMIAVVMVSIGLIVVTLVFPKATANISSNRRRVIASNFASSRIQEFKDLPYALVIPTPATGANFPNSGATISTPPTAGKCDCSAEDLSGAQFQEVSSSFTESSVTFTRYVCINLVTRNAAGTGWTSYCPNGQIGGTNGADQGLKSIRVRVSWVTGKQTNTLDTESMVMR
jgi:prepilin-type N-terminal cleavage/methylation domain-containing protein